MKCNLLYIGNKLSKHGMTVTSIEILGMLLNKEGYNLFYASSKRNRFLRLSEMLFQTIKYRKQIDYVLIDTYSTKNFWYAVLVSQLCRVLHLKYIPKLDGGDLPRRITKSPRWSKMVFKNAYKNVAPSPYLLEAFKDRGYAEILFIPNSIELQNYPYTVRETLQPKLLWVRSFSKIYNPGMAIEVLSQLKKVFPDSELCMVGPDKDGTLRKIKEMAQQRDLGVSFPGKLSKAEWIVLSKNYDIFINTTHYDNTPVSVIEAIALGLPIISTNVGGISYLLENNKTALLVDDNDVSGMVHAINTLMTDKQLKDELIKNAHLLVQDFDWQKVKNRWDDVLK